MKLALLLHLYQPYTQDLTVVKKVAEQCYLPLLKIINNDKDLRLTLNIPLSLMEKMEMCGYTNWLSTIRNLVEAERIELTGSGAYHPLLTKLPQEVIEKQIVLDEYGLGYYFGRTSGFEGEPSVMLRDVVGFFPPEMAINDNLVSTLNGLGYKWVVADETTAKRGVYSLPEKDIKLVVRDRVLSNLLSFKRDTNTDDVIENFVQGGGRSVVSLDGETFGHHFVEGIYLLETFINKLSKRGVEFVSVSEFVTDTEEITLENIRESTWGASDEEMQAGNIYPFWADPRNTVHSKLWELFQLVLEGCLAQPRSTKSIEDFENKPIWKESIMNSLSDEESKKSIELDLAMCRMCCSDSFWWASNKIVFDAQVIYHPGMVKSGMQVMVNTAKLCSEELANKAAALMREVEELL